LEIMSMRRIGILTGGGDVPGLNVVIKVVAQRCFAAGQEILGIRKGWQGIVAVDPDVPASREAYTRPLDPVSTRSIDRSGGTVLHSSRINPGEIRDEDLPADLDVSTYLPNARGRRDLTPLVLCNLERLGVDALVVTGGDDTLGYAAKLHAAGFPVVGVPKTMDNDVMGTDYCLGFSTAVTRSVDLIHDLRTPAGSHERIAVVELFGRYSGATALYVGMLTAADRVLVSEVPFETERICRMLVADQDRSPSNYALAVISEGAKTTGGTVFESGRGDAFGHRKLGGIGEWLCHEIRAITGRETLYQRLAYLMRSGKPDSLDRMVGLSFGSLAYDLLRTGRSGHMTAIVDGRYEAVPLTVVGKGARPANIETYYDRETYRPRLEGIEGRSILLA
jgi:6-phosphofructokinase 1